jgi:spermidine dehydrogenase
MTSDRTLGLDASISRRDFVNGVLVGSGLALASGAAARAGDLDLGPAWTGPGGHGDYARSNGNTHEVVNAAHRVRDGLHDAAAAVEPSERFDLIVVGGGLTGLLCAWEFAKRFGASKRCLLLDNHRIFGGEAKGNLFEVGGHRLEAPQGSNAFAVPPGGVPRAYWDELRIPTEYEFHEAAGATSGLRIARDSFGPMQYSADETSLGYWFRNELTGGRGAWRKDIWNDRLATAPWPESVKRDLLAWIDSERTYARGGASDSAEAGDILSWRESSERGGTARWLDTMSYAQFIEQVMGLSPAVSRFIDPLVAVGLSGTASDVVSAYGAQRILLPGVTPRRFTNLYRSSNIMTWPYGNAVLARYLVKAIRPELIGGSLALEDVVRQRFDAARADDAGAAVRLRLAATAVRIEHEGSANSAEHVRVTYERNGKLQAARARAVIMAGGGWMNRRVVRDLAPEIATAYATFRHGPVLTVNVALRNWRFLARLGISGARWFEGLGFFGNLIRPMKIGRGDSPLDPRLPAALTLYVPFLSPGETVDAQCSTGRARLLGPLFADFELQIREQMQEMFGSAGFEARRDIAGIILNRWGHAYICPQPGFFFGTEGGPAPRDHIRRGFGRIGFAHAELQGNQSLLSSMLEAKRVSDQILAKL